MGGVCFAKLMEFPQDRGAVVPHVKAQKAPQAAEAQFDSIVRTIDGVDAIEGIAMFVEGLVAVHARLSVVPEDPMALPHPCALP